MGVNSLPNSGVNPNIFGGNRGAEGAEGGMVWRGGVPLPTGDGAQPPLQNFCFDFRFQNGDLWCILGAIFCSSAKTLRGRKDTLAQVYFYWGGSNRSPRPPPKIDATVA